MAVTIKDVAALAGVSPSTVSRTCKNNPSISTETKEKVRKAMIELGYEVNFQASNLASQYSRTIGLSFRHLPVKYMRMLSILKQFAVSATTVTRDNTCLLL